MVLLMTPQRPPTAASPFHPVEMEDIGESDIQPATSVHRVRGWFIGTVVRVSTSPFYHRCNCKGHGFGLGGIGDWQVLCSSDGNWQVPKVPSSANQELPFLAFLVRDSERVPQSSFWDLCWENTYIVECSRACENNVDWFCKGHWTLWK